MPSIFEVLCVLLQREASQEPPHEGVQLAYVFKRTDVLPSIKEETTSKQTMELEEMAQKVPQFAFPGWPLHRDHSWKQMEFSFAMQAADGTRRHGYCLLSPQSPREALCVVSRYPWFSLFSKLLKVVQSRRRMAAQNSESDISHLLRKILESAFPKPGQAFAVTCPVLGQDISDHQIGQVGNDGMVEYRFRRPRESSRVDVHVEPLVRRLGITQLLMLISCCLEERRICFVGNSLSLVSTSIQTLMRMIYPFRWQYIFIPVLPRNLLSYLCAPMPYVIGIHSSMLPKVLKLPTEKMVMVNIDSGRVNGMDNCLSLPRSSKIQAMVHKHQQEYQRVDDAKVLNSILQSFLCMTGDYRLFMNLTGNASCEFDIEEFIHDKAVEERTFLLRFRESQMFQQWLTERKELFLRNLKPEGTYETECTKIVPWAYGMGHAPTNQISPLSRKNLVNAMSRANVTHTANQVRHNILAGGKKALQRSQHHGKTVQNFFRTFLQDVGRAGENHEQDHRPPHPKKHQERPQSASVSSSGTHQLRQRRQEQQQQQRLQQDQQTHRTTPGGVAEENLLDLSFTEDDLVSDSSTPSSSTHNGEETVVQLPPIRLSDLSLDDLMSDFEPNAAQDHTENGQTSSKPHSPDMMMMKDLTVQPVTQMVHDPQVTKTSTRKDLLDFF